MTKQALGGVLMQQARLFLILSHRRQIWKNEHHSLCGPFAARMTVHYVLQPIKGLHILEVHEWILRMLLLLLPLSMILTVMLILTVGDTVQ